MTTVESSPPRLPGQLLRFAVIGGVSTAAYLGLYLLLRPLGAQTANLIALLATAVANTAANRRFTFATRGSGGWWQHQAGGLVVFFLGLGLTSGSLALLHATTTPSRLLEVVALVVANGAATVLRFVLLRTWVFARHR